MKSPLTAGALPQNELHRETKQLFLSLRAFLGSVVSVNMSPLTARPTKSRAALFKDDGRLLRIPRVSERRDFCGPSEEAASSGKTPTSRFQCERRRTAFSQGRGSVGGVRGWGGGLLATCLDLIGGFWPEKGEHLWCGSAKLSMWQPHWWDQLFRVQRTVITSNPSVGVVRPPPQPLPPSPSSVHWLCESSCASSKRTSAVLQESLSNGRNRGASARAKARPLQQRHAGQTESSLARNRKQTRLVPSSSCQTRALMWRQPYQMLTSAAP